MTRIIGLAGWSGAGKTTLMVKLLPRLIGQGLSVSTLKHAHHRFDVDVPGKDSWEHRKAGAQQVMVASGARWALMTELRTAREPTLPELLARMDPADLIIVEGFKRDAHPKIEVHRAANGKPWMRPEMPGIVAVASDIAPPYDLPHALLDDVEGVAALVLAHARSVETIAWAQRQEA
ncbi:molybdopterin-guanine dinucleotide biosynthesis protein B [Roseomonas terrae]|uniref:Molybdopterin-guanine dinucleotide biosynthesis protein B n=1 Tax=Neoroseomonas terrae TaxID=424799 RepID=A0ABS5EID3_9PROT|nr:molybdopterin-guanine dinucleotide biosynthesis protein B [Neoroseomonas terrae]